MKPENNPKNKPRILVIEDEPDDMSEYYDELRLVAEIEICNGIIQAISYAEDRLTDFDLVILDVMMPTLGIISESETFGGSETGIVYFDRYLKNKPVDRPISVIVLTALSGKSLSRVKAVAAHNPKQIHKVCRKLNTEVEDLRTIVQSWWGEKCR